MILFRAATAGYFLADLLVTAAPVVVLAGGITVLGFAPPTSRRVVFELFSAGGARRVHGLLPYLFV